MVRYSTEIWTMIDQPQAQDAPHAYHPATPPDAAHLTDEGRSPAAPGGEDRVADAMSTAATIQHIPPATRARRRIEAAAPKSRRPASPSKSGARSRQTEGGLISQSLAVTCASAATGTAPMPSLP